MKKTVKIVIAHDHKILGQAMANLLSSQPDFLITALVDSITGARKAARERQADVIVAPASVAGQSATLTAKASGLLVIPLADGHLPRDNKAGKIINLSTEAGLADLYKFIRLAANRSLKFLKSNKSTSTPAGFSSLTAREREIFSLLAHGLSNQQIGRQLFITERTVKYHVSNLLRKLNAASRTEAAVKFMRAVG